jgi:hypothetical protein
VVCAADTPSQVNFSCILCHTIRHKTGHVCSTQDDALASRTLTTVESGTDGGLECQNDNPKQRPHPRIGGNGGLIAHRRDLNAVEAHTAPRATLIEAQSALKAEILVLGLQEVPEIGRAARPLP